MSPDSALKINKLLPLAIALALSSLAHAAEEMPNMTYAPPKQIGASPAVSAAPRATAPVVAGKPAAAASAAAVPSAAASGSTIAVAPPEAKVAVEAKSPAVDKVKLVEKSEPAAVKHAHARHVSHKVAPKKAATSKVASDDAAKDVTYSPQSANEITVSDHDLNDFVFGSPISNGPILPAGVPLVGKPIYMANNTQVLMQFKKGFDKSIQMVVETEDGKVHKLYLKPRAVSGITYRVDGARDVKVAATGATAPTANGEGGQPGARAEDIELLKRVVRGEVPSDFEAVPLPRPTRFDKFTVVPLSGWSDGTKKVMVFSLVAAPGQTAVVAPPQFYRQGIGAVMLTGDHVSETSTPQLFVVEELSNE